MTAKHEAGESIGTAALPFYDYVQTIDNNSLTLLGSQPIVFTIVFCILFQSKASDTSFETNRVLQTLEQMVSMITTHSQ